jgi:hypothetical protein
MHVPRLRKHWPSTQKETPSGPHWASMLQERREQTPFRQSNPPSAQSVGRAQWAAMQRG